METLHTLATMLPISLTSGINLYATMLVVGLSIRLGWVQDAPAGLQPLAAWPVLVVAGVFYIVEFLADKIPFVDNVWDTIHTFIRPLGAALLALAAFGKVAPELAAIGSLAAGGVALFSHSGKAGTRVAMNVASPAENISNVAVSLAEDVSVGVLAFLALKYPYLATGIALVALVLIALLAPRLIRWAWFSLRAIFGRLKGWVRKATQSDKLPASHLALLGHQPPELAARCKAQNLPGAGGRSGYLSLRGSLLSFTYERWLSNKLWQIAVGRVQAKYLRRRALLDVLEVHYLDAKDKPRVARFAFLKDRAPLAEQMAARLLTATA